MSSALNKAQDAHKNRQLDKALKLYNKIIDKEPNNIDALHGAGIASAQLQHYADAENYLSLAIKINQQLPESQWSPTLLNHYGNILKKIDRKQEAEKSYQHALQIQPNFFEAYNNLGSLYLEQGQIDKAITHYQHALELNSNYLDAAYNLGLAYSQNNDNTNARQAFEYLLQLSPDHIGGHYHLGKIAMTNQEHSQAINHFNKALEISPNLYEAHLNIAHCLLHDKQHDESRKHYQFCLEQTPQDISILFNLGILAEGQNNIDLAIQYYQKVLNIDPNHFASHNNLAVAFLKRQNPQLALEHFEKALEIQPDNESLKYNVAAIRQDKRLEAAPTNYVKNLFDGYAEKFEQHALVSLDYQVPKQLINIYKKTAKPKKGSLDIIDIGCGTGLCGPLFRPYANHMVGVDLSPKMIDQAHIKDCYDALHDMDMLDFMQDHPASADLIIAADVFVYIGNLDNVFAKCHDALKPKGHFIFSTEGEPDKDYTMTASGRFAHNPDYIKQLADMHGFKLITIQNCKTRKQYNKDVLGQIYLLRK